ncbi:hypothetical protein PAXINDRAFT_102011 [Paxillus involutus ATCC 200175]|uniref:EH domain-containing protein n=1 Tax=Paxillus involutus ATCC 200175 TaxID=664439 RepID=A0A0C9T4D2_PAXIN|nr:hypothetical protein PAXINDRAFT_102011 [Paxillus involutus ATCC 200175]
MPSASLQSRIQAFEALSTPSPSSTTTIFTIPAKSNNGTTSTNLLETPVSPTANAFHPIVPFAAATSSRSPSPSPPNLGRKTSLIDLKDWILEDGPVDAPAFRHTLSGGTSKLNGIRELSRTPPPRKPIPTYGTPNSSSTPLINFELPPKPRPPTRPRELTSHNASSTPLINFESPPKSRPPLPPRKPSYNARDPVPVQHSVSVGSETGAMLRPPGRSDSLTIEHTYPPGVPKFGASRISHAPASSISSFHSVSLSSDGNNIETNVPENTSKPPSFTLDANTGGITDTDTASIAESFENVSVPSAISPSTTIPFDWEKAMGKSKSSPKLEPPRLPQRPSPKVMSSLPPEPVARSVSVSSSSTTTSTKTRRPPPPPPSYQPFSRSRPPSSRASLASTSASTSDRSSIISNVTTTSRTSTSTRSSAQFGGSTKPSSLLRPTPVPPTARARYESLFISAVQGRRKAEKKKKQNSNTLAPLPLTMKKGRHAAGWRGLSVDLITNQEDHPYPSADKEKVDTSDSEDEAKFVQVGPEESLNGRIVKRIWSTSRLDRKKLRDIWNDCDPQSTGSLDCDAFVKGMWRIDEELRRAQLARRTSALTAASSQRIPHRPLPPPRTLSTSRLVV